MANPFLKEYEKPESLEEYKKALNIFYNPNAKCPSCTKEEITERSSTENTLKMSCKKCNWKVEIVIPKIVDIFVEESGSRLERVSAIYSMLFAAQQDNREFFDMGKKEFNTAEKMLKDVDGLVAKQEEDAQKIKKELYEKYNDLLDLYYKRQELYPKLDREGVINHTVKDLYTVVKNEGYPLSGSRLKGVATQYKLSEAVLGPWLEWLNYVVEYEKLKKDVKEKGDELEKFNDKLAHFNKAVMIEPPKIIGGTLDTKKGKKIKIPKSKIRTKKGGAEDLVVIKLE